MIKKFIIKDKQERYTGFISKAKTRKKFTNELYHFKDFIWKLFREIPGSENERQTILAKLSSTNGVNTCYIISANSKIDGQTILAEDAISNVVGTEATVLIFGEADVVYYEAEPVDGRYISL